LPDLTILVGGRSIDKARAFVEALDTGADLVPVAFDRTGALDKQLHELKPDLVIDASGPWQAYGQEPFRVAYAVIKSGAHYIDLADSTRFVCRFPGLDAMAKNYGVFAISGASTCPAITSAVVQHLGKDFSSIDEICGGIAPSPFAGMGRSVVEAIAEYAGKPVRILERGEVVHRHTFVASRIFTIAAPLAVPLPRLRFSLIDVPDLQLLAVKDVPVERIWFGVATRPVVYHALLRILARLVRYRIIPSVKRLAGLMHFTMNHLSWGEHRGGMFIEMCGRDHDGNPLTRSWHLVAEGDVGPNIPTLAAEAIVRSWLTGDAPEPGARSADGVLSLSDLAPQLDAMEITSGERTARPTDDSPMFQKYLDSGWGELDGAIRDLHSAGEPGKFSGVASVDRGKSALSRLIGRIVGFPAEGSGIPVSVRIDARKGKERWYRDFDGHRFASTYTLGKGRFDRLMCERFGPVKVGMALVPRDGKLCFFTRRWSFFGLPMPGFLVPRGETFEAELDGRFHFHAEINLPLVGHLVTYEGWLEPEAFSRP
jgi:hypothetical protein